MKASFVDFRKKPGEILRALDRNEPVTLTYRGKPKALVTPIRSGGKGGTMKSCEHPAFGMWADREDVKDVAAYVRKLRKPRFHGL